MPARNAAERGTVRCATGPPAKSPAQRPNIHVRLPNKACAAEASASALSLGSSSLTSSSTHRHASARSMISNGGASPRDCYIPPFTPHSDHRLNTLGYRVCTRVLGLMTWRNKAQARDPRRPSTRSRGASRTPTKVRLPSSRSHAHAHARRVHRQRESPAPPFTYTVDGKTLMRAPRPDTVLRVSPACRQRTRLFPKNVRCARRERAA